MASNLTKWSAYGATKAEIFAAGGGAVGTVPGYVPASPSQPAPQQNALAPIAMPELRLTSNALDPAAFRTAPNALANPLRHFPRFGNA
jgi:hypothetical protein